MVVACSRRQGAVRSADERAAELKESGAATAARADAAAADAARASQVIDKLSVSCCPNRSRQHDIWVSRPLWTDCLTVQHDLGAQHFVIISEATHWSLLSSHGHCPASINAVRMSTGRGAGRTGKGSPQRCAGSQAGERAGGSTGGGCCRQVSSRVGAAHRRRRRRRQEAAAGAQPHVHSTEWCCTVCVAW
jgi:hypothetical protein